MSTTKPAFNVKSVVPRVPVTLSTPRKSRVKVSDKNTFSFDAIFRYSPQHRIDLIKEGLPAIEFDILASKMDVAKDVLIDILGFSRTTINRKIRDIKPLARDESERLLGMQSLIGQVERMVRESGNPAGFDAAIWISNWLQRPQPILRGNTPASYMDTVEGQKLISALLAQVQSGAYA